MAEKKEKDVKLAIKRAANKLQRELLQNLAARGLTDTMTVDQVAEYISLWQIKEELGADIKARGAVIFDDRKGQICENPCITKRVQISQQMSKIYKCLGFEAQAAQARPVGDDDEL